MPNAVLRKGIARAYRFLKHLSWGTYQLSWESKSGASIFSRNKLLINDTHALVRLDSRVSRLNNMQRSLYDGNAVVEFPKKRRYKQLVKRFCTPSSLFFQPALLVQKTTEAYSTTGRTREQYNALRHLKSLSSNITPKSRTPQVEIVRRNVGKTGGGG